MLHHLDPFHFIDVQMFAIFAWDLIHKTILLRRYTAFHMYKGLSQYVRRLESSTNFQGVTDILCSFTDVTYIEEIKHLLPVIFNCCSV